jgi:tRNA(Ile)-lysidine synthetase-like protein
MQLAKRVWDFSTSQDLLHDGDRVVVGVSGGPDSLCLLDVLHGLAQKHRLELHVAHLNHGLRPEAAAEAEFVRAEAEGREAGFFSETVDAQSVAQSIKQSLESAARQLRYDFFRRVAQQVSAGLVAVAHTADDQAETVLMHLLRGTGLRGLRGMVPKRVIGEVIIGNWPSGPSNSQLPMTHYKSPIFLIRPLLQTTRSQVLDYCAKHKLSPRVDSTNADTRYLRNRVRHDLLPMLETYNPNLRAVLARTAAAAAGDYNIWQAATNRLWTETVRSDAGAASRVDFDRRQWLQLSSAEQRALLRAAAEYLLPRQEEFDFAPLDAAVQFSRHAAPGRSCQVAGGLVLRVDEERIAVSCRLVPADSGNWPSVVDGALAPGWRLLIEHLEPDNLNLAQIAAASRWSTYVDTERLQGRTNLRARRAGDRFRPLGLKGHTVKLSDYFVNQKIPARWRQTWPLLTCGDDIVWVVGLRLDERYKVTGNTRSVTRLSVTPESDE